MTRRRDPERPDTSGPSSHAPPPQRPLASNASWRLAGIIARVVIGLLCVPLYTRMLGMSQWGLLALFQAATSPLALLDLGLGAATVKYVAESVGRGDRPRAVRVFHTTLLFNLGMSAVGVAGLLLASRWLATSLFEIPPAETSRAVVGFRVMAASWVIGIVTATYASVATAHQRFDTTSKLAVISSVLTTAAGLLTAALGGDVVAVLLVQTAVSAALVVVYFRVAVWLLPGVAALPRWDGEAFRRCFSFGIWQAVAMVGSFLAGWGDRYILGAYFLPAIVGFYAIVNGLYTQAYGAFLEMGEVLFPAVSHLEGQGDLAGARRLTLLVGWTLTTGFGIAGAVLAVVGGDFLHLWISPEAAREATTTLRLLCVAGPIGMAAIAPFYYLLGIGRTKWDAASALIVGAMVLAAGLVLVPRYGMRGVGYGLIAAVLVRWGMLGLIWRSFFREDVSFGSYAAHVFAPAITSVAVLAALVKVHAMVGRSPSWPWLAVETAAALVVVGGAQLAANELLPGGRQRRQDVVASFRPVLAKAMGALAGR